jgi:outer membrane protein OmpA-like peptidoglycan-associated protein
VAKNAWLIIGLVLPLAAALVAREGSSAELVKQDEIIAKLRPAKTRSLGVVPTISLDVKFEFASAKLTDEARRQIDELGQALASTELESYRFQLAGHTDAVGTAEYNRSLSERRSAAVKDYLVQHFNISAMRLESVGWGFHKLRNPNDPQAAENRRVEIANLGKP